MKVSSERAALDSHISQSHSITEFSSSSSSSSLLATPLSELAMPTPWMGKGLELFEQSGNCPTCCLIVVASAWFDLHSSQLSPFIHTQCPSICPHVSHLLIRYLLCVMREREGKREREGGRGRREGEKESRQIDLEFVRFTDDSIDACTYMYIPSSGVKAPPIRTETGHCLTLPHIITPCHIVIFCPPLLISVAM